MKYYQEYLKTRQKREGFLTWILIRKMTFRHQSLIIGILIFGWLMAAPYLIFWVNFFKFALLIGLILAVSHTTKWLIRRLKHG